MQVRRHVGGFAAALATMAVPAGLCAQVAIQPFEAAAVAPLRAQSVADRLRPSVFGLSDTATCSVAPHTPLSTRSGAASASARTPAGRVAFVAGLFVGFGVGALVGATVERAIDPRNGDSEGLTGLAVGGMAGAIAGSILARNLVERRTSTPDPPPDTGSYLAPLPACAPAS